MSELGIKHQDVTNAQHRLFKELEKSGRPNTLEEHIRIAIESLMEAGLSIEDAVTIVKITVQDLFNQGVKEPSRIPWGKK